MYPFAQTDAYTNTYAHAAQPDEPQKSHSAAQSGDLSAEKRSFILGTLPSFRLSKLLKKPILLPDGALSQLGGVTFSLNGGKIKHLVVRLSPALDAESNAPSATAALSNDRSELYLPFADAKLSDWHVTPSSARPRSPKGTARLTLGKSVYSTGGTYYGKLTDAIVAHGRLSLLCVGERTFAAENLFAVGDALLLRPALPYPLGQSIPPSFRDVRAVSSNDSPFKSRSPVAVRLPSEVTRSALRYFLHTGQLVAFTTSLPLFRAEENV